MNTSSLSARQNFPPAALLLLIAVLLGSTTLTAAPCIYVDDLDFGMVRVGESRSLDLRFSNHGSGIVTFNNPAGGDVITWLDQNFTVNAADKDALKAAVLGPGEFITIKVTFNALTPGIFRATARFWANTRDCRDTSVWTAGVIEPVPQITGYDWKVRWVTTLNSCTKSGISEYDTVLFVSNTGNSNFTVSNIELIGADAPYFHIDSSQATRDAGQYISPGEEIKVGETPRLQKVSFTPKDERSYLVEIKLTTTDGLTVSAFLSGMGIESHISIVGFNFGSREFIGPGSVMVQGYAVLQVNPTRPTTITDAQIIGPDAVDFQIDPDPTRWATGVSGNPAPYDQPISNGAWRDIPIGTILTIPVLFKPQSTGVKSVMLQLTGDFSMCDSSTDMLVGTTTSAASVDNPNREFHLSQNEPNPFTNRTSISFSLVKPNHATLVIYNVAGAKVTTLVDGDLEAGEHQVSWDAIDQPDGIYLCRLTSGGISETRVMVVVR